MRKLTSIWLAIFASTLMAVPLYLLSPLKGSSAPFSPTQVAGLKCWLKARGLGLSDGTSVSTWTDSSSNGYNITGAGATPPVFKTNIINGQPILRFDGASTTWLTGTGAAQGNIIANSAYSVWIVLQTSAINHNNTVSANPYANDLVWGGTFVYTGMLMRSGGPNMVIANFPSAYNRADQSGFSLNSPFIAHGRHDSGNIIVSVNNGTEASFASGNTNAGNTDALLIGGGATAGVFPATMDLAEILFYNVAVSSTDRTKIWNYLDAIYAAY